MKQVSFLHIFMFEITLHSVDVPWHTDRTFLCSHAPTNNSFFRPVKPQIYEMRH